MKRFLLLTLSLTLLLIFPAQTLASVPPPTSRTISEYDMICQERTTARNNVQSGLMTAQEAAQLKIFKVEDELLRLASLPSQDLASMGYTASQIAILKAYKGGPLEDHPEMRAVMSSFSFDISCKTQNASTTSFIADFSWEWSSRPLFVGVDYAVFLWEGTSISGNPVNTAIDMSDSSATVSYYFVSGGGLYGEVPLDYTMRDQYGYICYDIDMQTVTPAAESIWAKCGEAAICVNRTGTATFSEAKFGFCYGHEYISIVPTITCSTNPISVSFSSGITTMCLDTKRFSASGVELD